MEASQPAQTRGQGIQTSFARKKSRGEGERAAGRAALSQSRGQYAHGSEDSILEEKIWQEEARRPQARGIQEGCKKISTQTLGQSARKGPARRLDRGGPESFAKKDGSHLKPGVRKRASEMTPTDMRRKGSWAVRFYGRAKLPPLVDRDGKPTRHALSAHAWGEPVPKTAAAARRIAAKGERLLARYHRTKKA